MAAKNSSSDGVGIYIFLLLTSIFLGLILSIWALISKKSGRGYVVQLILSLISIGFFGYYLSYQIYMNYTPGDDKFVYYIAMIGTYSNGLAALVWLMALFTKSE